ncbi:hypothetical protein [Serratia rubidaea]|uniref:hypothetical protein n=1 Tax=Serratia rubidaea TaxID=61652 RepID=UPI0007735C76|nr:hypothetical protein [Serratia rubidaea]
MTWDTRVWRNEGRFGGLRRYDLIVTLSLITDIVRSLRPPFIGGFFVPAASCLRRTALVSWLVFFCRVVE